MRNLMRSYKLKLQRKPSQTDSDCESQPLASSISSTASFGTVNERCMFPHDSDVTDDFEYNLEARQKRRCLSDQELNEIAMKQSKPSMDKLSPFLQRPFCYPKKYNNNDHQVNHNVGFQYFYKGSKSCIIDDSLLPQKLMTFKDYKSGQKEESFENVSIEEPTQSSLVTIFAIWNTIMGSSLLAISWGLEKAGLFPGIFLILFIAAICLYTSYVILKVNESYGIYKNNEVPDLCRLLLGRWAEIIAKIFSLIVLIGANIVYWILMSNFLYNSVTFFYDYIFSIDEGSPSTTSFDVLCLKDNSTFSLTQTNSNPASKSAFDTYWNLNSTVPVFLSFLMFPLLNFKSPTFFTKFNSLGTISVAYLVLLVIVKGSTWGLHIPDWSFEFEIKGNFSALSGMLSLSFFIHNIIISICKNNRHQENNGRDLSIAFILVTLTYLIVGVVFYISFPLAKSCLEDNILNNFPKYDAMAIIARMLLLFQLFTVFPLISFMLRVNILINMKSIFNHEKFGEFTYGRVIVLNLFVVIICTLFACFLPHIGTLIRYTGALSGMVYIFTLPNLLKIAALRRENSLTIWNFSLHAAIICVGAANLALQFFIRDS